MTISDADFNFLSQYIFDHSAIVLGPDKKYLVESRLGSLCHKGNLGEVSSLVRILREGTSRQLGREIIEAMATNETYFFRDIKPFDALREEILPSVIEANRTSKRMRIWCAASSSGQEPYSVAIVIKEHFPILGGWDVKIMASDISRAMVSRTQAAIYSNLEVKRGLPSSLLARYFDRLGDGWRVKTAVKALVDPFEFNLVEKWPSLGLIDVILIRNVLIYFDTPTKQLIFTSVEKAVRPGGFVMLGGSESTLGMKSSLERNKTSAAHYYTVPAAQDSMVKPGGTPRL